MPAGNQPSDAAGEQTLDSGAALVPSSALLIHVVILWAAAYEPALLRRWLPWPLEALLVWLPWASLCLWVALPHLRTRSPRAWKADEVRDALIAMGALFCSLHYVLTFRLASARELWSPERYLSELSAFFSTTTGGAPWIALAYAIGWTACSLLVGRVVGNVSAAWAPESRLSGRLGPIFTWLAFLIGSSAMLRYATGSPWPLFGSR